MTSSTFCPMPFSHLNIKHEGKVSACWRYPDELGNYTSSTLEEIWNNKNIKQLRKSLLNSEKPAGCKSCWDLEASNSKSTRLQQMEERFSDITEDKVKSIINEDFSYPIEQLTQIEVRFDNTCNLMCRMCNADYSSQWERAVKKDEDLLAGVLKYSSNRKFDYHIKLTDDVIDQIKKLSNNLTEILIAGGEPIYHEKHYSFLESLQDNAKNIVLSYNSNLNSLTFKGKNIIDLWKNFKKIILRVSIDGDPSCYEYVRVNGNLNKVEQNLSFLKTNLTNADISATNTVSLFNITHFVDIIKYFRRLDVQFHSSLVQYPRPLNIKLLPIHIKEHITNEFNYWILDNPNKRTEKYSRNIINYMNSEDWHSEWQTFIDYANILDDFHDTKLLDVYPEYNL